jgi:hypothetical protein
VVHPTAKIIGERETGNVNDGTREAGGTAIAGKCGSLASRYEMIGGKMRLSLQRSPNRALS